MGDQLTLQASTDPDLASIHHDLPDGAVVCSSPTTGTWPPHGLGRNGTTFHHPVRTLTAVAGNTRRSTCTHGTPHTTELQSRLNYGAVGVVASRLVSLDDVTNAARELAVLRNSVSESLLRRDDEIRRAFNDGCPIGAIATAANVTAARVSSILEHPHHRVGRPARTAETH